MLPLVARVRGPRVLGILTPRMLVEIIECLEIGKEPGRLAYPDSLVRHNTVV